MKTKLLILGMLGLFLSIQFSYGDNIPSQGKWGDDYWRSIVPLPPTLLINGNVLCVQFMDVLDDLTVCVINNSGILIYEHVISGEKNEVFDISLERLKRGTYQVTLVHSLGWLQGDF